IGSITISLVSLGVMIADKENNVFSDFLVSPIKRNALLISYLTSSVIIGFSVLLFFVICFNIYFLAIYSIGFTLQQMFFIIGIILASIAFGNVFMLLLISFFKTQQSVSSFGTIIGTLIGFVTGAYIPVGVLPSIVGDIFSAMPFFQLTAISRKIFLYEIDKATPISKDMVSGDLAKHFGLEVWIGDTAISNTNLLIIIISCTVILLGILSFRFSKMKKED
ncbi:MAG: ABC transporter permease, partial [Oscillospiraceae bacterium]